METLNRNYAGLLNKPDTFDPTPYLLDPIKYIKECLGWHPWEGRDGHPGQVEILDTYKLIMAKQLERRALERGEAIELRYYTPGEVIKNWIRIESGNSSGKTRLLSGIVNHFFDCFSPSITYTFAPSWAQIHDLLWKEIKATRGKAIGLPGQIFDLKLERAEDHFAIGKATHDSRGAGLERVQGQHSEFLLMILDEGEGIQEYVYKAVDTMTSGGIAVVVIAANPKSRITEFYRRRSRENVVNIRLNCIYHPNVLEDRDIIPGAIRREAIELSLITNCQIVNVHDPDKYTFEVPWRPGVIYLPNSDFCRTVLGITPPEGTIRTIVPRGRYEEACRREVVPDEGELEWATVGVDVARDGSDLGTIWVRYAGLVWRHARLSQLDGNQYAGELKELCLELHVMGVKRISIRIDKGGGFGGSVSDCFSGVREGLDPLFELLDVTLIEFGWKAWDETKYADRITELYAEAAETMKGIRILNAPPELEVDLCDRLYTWVNRAGKELRRLEPKEEFRKRNKRSSDDGDGFVLCVASDRLTQFVWCWA